MPEAPSRTTPFSSRSDATWKLRRVWRWMRDRLRDGWSYGEPRDDERRLHPSLIPDDELPEAEREKDRDAVRDLPRMLAEAGFEIHRVGAAAPPAIAAISDPGRTRAPARSDRE